MYRININFIVLGDGKVVSFLFFGFDNDSSYMEVKVNVYRWGIHVNGEIERIASFYGGCMASGLDN